MKTLAAVITFLFITLYSSAQPSATDSLARLLNKLPAGDDTSRALLFIGISNQWSKSNPDSAIFFAKTAFTLSARQNFKAGMAESKSIEGSVYTNMGRFAEGYENYTEALKYFTEIQDEKGTATVYNGLGVNYGMQENYTEALPYFLKALNFFEKNKVAGGMASSYIKIGTLYQKIHEYDKSLIYFKRAVLLSQSINDKVNEAFAYNNIGTVYGITQQYQKCLEATLRSKQLAEEAKSVPALATACMNLGMAYTELKQFDQAGSSLSKALFYFKKLKREEQVARTYNGLGNLCLAQQKYEAAKKFIDSSNALAKELNNHGILYDNYETLVSIDKGEGKFEAATQVYEEMLALKDTLFDNEKNSRIERLKASYDLKKKQTTIEELEKDNQTKTRQRNYLVLAFAAGSLLAILLLLSLLKIKRKNNLLEKQKKELAKLNELKVKFFSILSHDLRSPIGNILLVIDLLTIETDVSAEERQDLFKKLKSAASSTLETMDNMLEWGRFQLQNIPVAPKKIDVQETAQRVSRFLNQTASNKSITIINKIEEPFIVEADENQFEFILRNLLSNSIKFSHPSSIVEIWARKLNSFICIYIKDYGTGMNRQLQENLFDSNARVSINGTSGEIGSGLGLVLCNEFITKNNGTLTVKSEEGKGTTFAIKLPAKEN